MKDLGEGWIWFLSLGIILIVLGLFSITTPFMSGLVATICVGIVFLVSGISHIVQSFGAMKWKGIFFLMLSGVIYIIAGLMLVTNPNSGLLFFTLVISMLLMMEGFFEIFSSFQMPTGSGWGWFLFGGIANLLLGIFIWRSWPVSALWFIGLAIGLNLIFKGWAFVWFSLVFKKGSSIIKQEFQETAKM